MSKKKIAFLVSGNGSNMQNLIERMRSGTIPADPVLVICNRPEAGALERAVCVGCAWCV